MRASRRHRLRRGALLVLGLVAVVAGAGAQYFGQNKVPGPPRNWRVLESAHFELYFYEAERTIAAQTLQLAERAYARLRRIHRHDVSARIPVILYASQSEFRQTRAASGLIGEGTAGLTELYKRRVIVPAFGSIAEMDHVLTHELEHAFQIDILQGRTPGGGAQPLRWAPPLWVMEGLCEYLSVPGLDANTEMWLRDAALNGRLIDIETLALVGDLRVYRFGQAIVAYIAERFGTEALGPWFRTMARRRSFARGTAESIGMTVEKLSTDWRDWVRRRYLGDLARFDAPEGVARRLTDHRRSLADFHVTPAVSPDGTQLTYVANETPYPDVFTASAIDGSHVQRIIKGARSETFESVRYFTSSIDWAPSGRTIALIGRIEGEDRLTLFDVVARRVTGEFTFGFDEMQSPSWSPDGERLVFVGLRAGRSNLYSVGADGRGLEPLTADRWAALQPAWSPEGKRIAYVTDEGHVSHSPAPGSSPWQIAVLDLETGQRELLALRGGKSINPQWFPDGRHLLFISDRSGISNLFVHDLELQIDYQLTDLHTGISGITPTGAAVSLSDDGRRAVFSVYQAMGWDLFALKEPLQLLQERAPWAPAVAQAESVAGPLGSAALGAAHAASHEPPGQAALSAVSARGAPDTPPAPRATPVGQQRRNTAAAGDTAQSALRERPPVENLAFLFTETAALPETTIVRERPYRSRLTIDFVEAGGLYATGFGAVAQTVVGFSDVLGHRNLFVGADVAGSFAEGNYYLGYLNQSRRPAWSVAAYQYLSGYGYGALPGYPDLYLKRLVRGVGAGLIYPLSRFRRLELSLDAVQEQRYRWECETLSGTNIWRCGWEDETGRLNYAAPRLAYVHDSALFGSTGPLSGKRSRLAGGVFIGDRRAWSAEADYRFYWNVRKRYAFALRTVFAGEWGPDRERLAFGGPYSLRGHTESPLYGTSIAFMNVEFRFPFIENLHLAWPLRFALYGIRGALFCDLGAAWDDARDFRAFRSDDGGWRLDDLHAAVGFRAAINLGFTVLRWDLARRTDFAGWRGKARGEVSIGWEF